MLQFNSIAGDTIDCVVNQMIDIARVGNQAVTTLFNDIEVTVNANSIADEVVSKFEYDIEARHKAWLESEAGITTQAERDARRLSMQQQCDTLLAQLDMLDFSNDVEVLNWLCELADCADNVNVDSKPSTILAKFAYEGYHANVNCGADFNGDDRENFMRYIVDQALGGIAVVGAPHGIIHKFTADWRTKFAV